jgi:hypothetical protein
VEGAGASPTDIEYAALSRLIDVLAERGSKLSDRRPDRTIRARVTKASTYVSYLRYEGFGGLPVGVNGRAVVLYSGGAGSYRAAEETMRAGMEVTLLYLYSKGTPAAHIRRAVATATLLREHHGSKGMALVAADFDGPISAIREGFDKGLRPTATHRAMASAAARLATREGATWISSGLTVDSGIENVAAYSAEVAARGVTAMFPVASMTSEELWRSVSDERLKAKMPKLSWRLVPRSGRSGRVDEGAVAKGWASGRPSKEVEESVAGSFRVGLGRGFIDYFDCLDSFASKMKSRGNP